VRVATTSDDTASSNTPAAKPRRNLGNGESLASRSEAKGERKERMSAALVTKSRFVKHLPTIPSWVDLGAFV